MSCPILFAHLGQALLSVVLKRPLAPSSSTRCKKHLSCIARNRVREREKNSSSIQIEVRVECCQLGRRTNRLGLVLEARAQRLSYWSTRFCTVIESLNFVTDNKFKYV